MFRHYTVAEHDTQLEMTSLSVMSDYVKNRNVIQASKQRLPAKKRLFAVLAASI